MQPMRYVPYHELADIPNVIVDGAPQQATVLTLSHWPRSHTPAALADDLSAQIAFRWLDARDRYPAPAVVSNNHFDEDGLVSVFALCEPELAHARRELLIDVARAGDFGSWLHRDAARIAMAINACADPDTSPLDLAAQQSWADRTAALYDSLLGRLAAWCDHPARIRELWAPGDAHLQAGLDAIAAGRVTIEEHAATDLAVVTLPDDPTFVLSEHALHHATERLRVLTVSGRRYRFTYRYETWVQLHSRRPLARVDLAPLARRLAEADPDADWCADPVDHITPSLTNATKVSRLDPETVRRELLAHLAAAPAAWDPYGD